MKSNPPSDTVSDISLLESLLKMTPTPLHGTTLPEGPDKGRGESKLPLDGVSDVFLLESLRDMKPSPLRRTTLLEGLDMSRREVPQSRFLAWLLAPQGPTNDCWLLKDLLHLAAPSMPWPGAPQSVLPEVRVGFDRPDIVAEWTSFKLIIEYKVDSAEGDDQVHRYLETFSIQSPNEGLAIYLTPAGERPKSVPRDDSRVQAISFEKLIERIDAGLAENKEPSERGRAMVTEYRACLSRVLNRSISVEKPIISDATKLLCKHYEHYDRLVAAAKNESADFMKALAARAEKQLRGIMGADMVVSTYESYGYSIFRKPKWKTAELLYGIAYGCEGKPGGKLMPQYKHCVVVRVQPYGPDGNGTSGTVEGQHEFAESLQKAIDHNCPIPNTGSNGFGACWDFINFGSGVDWDKWADDLLTKLCDLARNLTPVIDRFAARNAGK